MHLELTLVNISCLTALITSPPYHFALSCGSAGHPIVTVSGSPLCMCPLDVLLLNTFIPLRVLMFLNSPPLFPHANHQNEVDGGASAPAVKEAKEMSLLDGKRAQVCEV